MSITKLNLRKSGDYLGFQERSVKMRHTIFTIELEPVEVKKVFIDIRNDGEENSKLLLLISQQILE
ncbi:hypothetical protein OQZ33_04100 [Pedobacter sp. MC2016-05]|uniref:hypothetical protein n=1 Tax=Pedobacter sp. MC2016-05 TaxID=2994474 RepID=UPI002246715D|nr:hypothetical protein [Pedobacter sp. MC2016-05]MCX2473507.1 hypothetical protein [Pedobacter sp. MC2016-05]